MITVSQVRYLHQNQKEEDEQSDNNKKKKRKAIMLAPHVLVSPIDV